jgi:hypothetical protein
MVPEFRGLTWTWGLPLPLGSLRSQGDAAGVFPSQGPPTAKGDV